MVNTGRVHTRPGQGSGWADLTRTRGTLWYSHVMSMGSYWAVVYGLRCTVDQEMLVHGPQTGLRWTESTLRLLGVVHVHWVYARVAGEGGVPLFLPRPCSCRRRACW